MNSADILFAVIILAPVVVLLALKINAALVFLSLCLGNVLTQFVAGEAGSFLTVFSAHSGKTVTTTPSTLKLVLLLLPVVLTAIFMVRTVHGNGKLVLNALPSLGVGLLGALLAVPLLPAKLTGQITHGQLWHQVTMLQTLIVGLSALLCLFTLWLQRPKTGDEKHGH